MTTGPNFAPDLAALGLTLDDKAFAAAWAGAQHLRGEVAKVEDYLPNMTDPADLPIPEAARALCVPEP